MLIDSLKRIDKTLLIIPVILGLISCFMISSIDATAAEPYSRQVVIQITAYLIGYALLILAVVFDYKIFFKLDKFLYIAAVLLQALVFVPGLGQEIFGAARWINIGAFTL